MCQVYDEDGEKGANVKKMKNIELKWWNRAYLTLNINIWSHV